MDEDTKLLSEKIDYLIKHANESDGKIDYLIKHAKKSGEEFEWLKQEVKDLRQEAIDLRDRDRYWYGSARYQIMPRSEERKGPSGGAFHSPRSTWSKLSPFSQD